MRRPAPRLLPSEGERLATLETQFDGMATRLDGIDTKLTQLHDLFVGAKAIKWLIAGLIALSVSTGSIVVAGITVFRFLTGH
jgi:Flp pilus assembly protein TadB